MTRGAIPHLQRAIELDPNFAMAYATLGVVYGNLSRTKQQQENLSKAFELKDRASEREKFYISAHYYSEGTGELDKSGRDLRAVEADLSTGNLAVGQSGAALRG